MKTRIENTTVGSSGNLQKPDSKGRTYKLAREIVKKFEERNHTLVCKELKGVGTGTVIRECPDCVRDAAEFVEQVLFGDCD